MATTRAPPDRQEPFHAIYGHAGNGAPTLTIEVPSYATASGVCLNDRIERLDNEVILRLRQDGKLITYAPVGLAVKTNLTYTDGQELYMIERIPGYRPLTELPANVPSLLTSGPSTHPIMMPGPPPSTSQPSMMMGGPQPSTSQPSMMMAGLPPSTSHPMMMMMGGLPPSTSHPMMMMMGRPPLYTCPYGVESPSRPGPVVAGPATPAMSVSAGDSMSNARSLDGASIYTMQCTTTLNPNSVPEAYREFNDGTIRRLNRKLPEISRWLRKKNVYIIGNSTPDISISADRLSISISFSFTTKVALDDAVRESIEEEVSKFMDFGIIVDKIGFVKTTRTHSQITLNEA